MLAGWTQSPVKAQRETSLLCFSRILMISETIENLFEIVSNSFVACLHDNSPVIQQVSAVGCVDFASSCPEFEEIFTMNIPKLFEVS